MCSHVAAGEFGEEAGGDSCTDAEAHLKGCARGEAGRQEFRGADAQHRWTPCAVLALLGGIAVAAVASTLGAPHLKDVFRVREGDRHSRHLQLPGLLAQIRNKSFNDNFDDLADIRSVLASIDDPSEDEGALLSESVTAGDTLLHVENTHNLRKGGELIVVDTVSTSAGDFEAVVAKEVFFDSIELADPIGRDFPIYSWVIMPTDVPTLEPTPTPTNSAPAFEAPIGAAWNEDSAVAALSPASAPVVSPNRVGDEVAGFMDSPAYEAEVPRGPAHKEAPGTRQLAFLGSILFSLATCSALGSLLLYFLLRPYETALADNSSQGPRVREWCCTSTYNAQQVRTTTTHLIMAGSERLCVESTEAFNVGETVEISSDAGKELMAIREIDMVYYCIVLGRAVNCTHPPGAIVSQALKDSGMLVDVFHSSQRRSLIGELFDIFDVDKDDMLNSEELLAFMKLADFKGAASEGEEIVMAISHQPSRGCSLFQFTSLLDDHQGCWYYSDDDLKDFLNKAMERQKGDRSQTEHSSQSAQDVMR